MFNKHENKEQINKKITDRPPGKPPRGPTIQRYSRLPVQAILAGLTRDLGLLLFAVLAILLAPAAGVRAEGSASAPSSDSVWYADGASLVQVDTTAGKAVRTVDLPRGVDSISALASNSTDGSIVVLSKGRLLGFDASGKKTFGNALGDASNLGEKLVLASDPNDGSLWVGGKGLLVRTNDKGENQRSVMLGGNEVVRAVHPSQEDGSAWILSTLRFLHISEDGEVLDERTMQEEGISSPRRLAVDELSGYAYVTDAKEIVPLALEEAGSLEEPPRRIAPEGGVENLALDPVEGTVYVANHSSLYAYNGSGEKQKVVDLTQYRSGKIRALSFDAPSRTLWLRGEDKLLGFSEGLDESRADIKAKKQGAGPSLLAAKAPKLSLRLSLLEPQNGAVLNNPEQPVKLKIEAMCNNKPCPTKRVKKAEKKLRLNASLNGEEVGSFFTRSGSLATPDGVTMTYAPAAGLPEDDYSLSAYASVSKKNRSNQLEAAFTVDTSAPRFSNVKPGDGTTIPEEKATITGEVDDANARVYLEKLTELGGKVISDDPSGFSFEVPLKNGENSFRLLAYDEGDNMGQHSLRLVHEMPLAISITEPEPNSTVTTAENEIDVKGTVEGPEDTTVKVGSIDAIVDAEGSFVAEDVPLVRGHNTISVTATAPGGKSVQETLELDYDPDPPDTEPPPDPSEPNVRIERPPDSPVPTPGPLPEDPQEIAPDVEPGVATDLFDATRFLYEGENPIQTGVEEGAIEEELIAVLKGKVLDRAGNPVPGVRITVLDQPELGQTLTREDGQFDIAVNGGGPVTLYYEKDRYMPAQRQIEAPWRDFAAMQDVVLAGFSRKVTDVDLEASDEMQVARGSATTDEDGTRQATVLLPGDTEAEMVMPDGSTQALSEIEFRATEYTVGDQGPEAMPGVLPATSGYTYAVELSVDEAVENGASEVRFTEPLYNYVENYLGFPVGSDVPNGYYDRDKGQWVPSDDGVVIEVLSVENGVAELDVDGSGTPADTAALEALGITDEERQKLAGLYDAGQSLWRVPIAHFTPWDHNWPYGPPEDAVTPNQPPVPDPNPEPEPDCQAGSVIECQNQILGENLDVSGAPFSLHYGSDGVPGRTTSRTLDIPLSGASVPGSLKRIQLEISVAGQKSKRSFTASPNRSYTFHWDGKDAYGRAITGEQEVTYRIGYDYTLEYKATPADFQRSFGRIAGASLDVTRNMDFTIWQEGKGKVASWDDRAQGLGGWTPDVLHQYDPEEMTLRLGSGDRRRSADLGKLIYTAAGNGESGFSGDGGSATEARVGRSEGLAVASDGSYYVADGENNRVRRVDPDGIITTVAGNGFGGFAGDGGPATSARLSHPEGLAVAPDGSLYIADEGNHRVRRVGTDGIITTVAGSGDACGDACGGFSGDGGPATSARLNRPEGLTIAPDGSLYVNDQYNNRVRRVGTDGTISTIAGSGPQGYSGDGGPATNARLNLIDSGGVVMAPDGSLYIADYGNNVVRRVGTDGIITTVVGNGANGYSGDGGPARSARLSFPNGLALAPDGSLYIADEGNNRVRQVTSDGTITTVAGGGSPSDNLGDKGPARDAALYDPHGLALTPDGDLYVADHFNRRVRWVGLSKDAIVVSDNGTQLYYFDAKGKHQRTLDALTGAVLYRFFYDEEGRLNSVEDVDGLTTQIERDDSSGNATGIIASNGDRTELVLDASGYLESVSNPDQETTSFTYYDGGLLKSLTDAEENTTNFTYDDKGRLKRDEDPAGGFSDLSRTDRQKGYTVSLEKASGRKTTYATDRLPDGSSRRVTTASSGLKTEKVRGTDGDQKATSPDGTTIESTLSPDPRFGMQSPVEKTTVKTPQRRSLTTAVSRQGELQDPRDPASATTVTETVSSGDRTVTSTYDRAAKTIEDTSPQGRTATTTLDDKGRPVKEEAPGFATTSYAYDERGRLEEVSAGGSLGGLFGARKTTYTYDEKDRVETVKDPSDKEWGFEYDDAGRLEHQTLPGGRTISYGYDDNGNLTSVTTPEGSVHEFGYESRDFRESYDAPQVGQENRRTSYEKDLDRMPRSRTLPGGARIEYTYDEQTGRPKKVSYPEGEKNYTYDSRTGKIATMSTGDSNTLTYAFDGFLPVSETATGTVPGKVELQYDSNLRVSGIKVNNSPAIPYTYDKDDLIESAGSLDLVRDPERGLVTGTTLSGITDERSHNDFGELESFEASSGTTQLYEVTYDERDSLGRIEQKTETIEGETETYTYVYDAAGNLEEVRQDGEVVASYTYDNNGNRLSHTTASGTTEGSYDGQDRLETYGGNDYSFTPDGRLVSKTDTATGESVSYDYDSLGNLLSATLPDKEIEYVVDAKDRRVGKKVDGILTQGFVYGGRVAPVAELDGSGNVVSRFVYATKATVPDYMEKDGKTYRIISDNLGSVRLVVDAQSGEVAQRLDYDEFGNVLSDSDPGFQPFGFAGGLYDQDTKLTRFGVRDYDAETGRWTAKDPILFGGGQANLYAYVSNDPINLKDPLGLYGWSDLESDLAGIESYLSDINSGLKDFYDSTKEHWFGKERDPRVDEAADKAMDWALNEATDENYGKAKDWLDKINGAIENLKTACRLGSALEGPADGESGADALDAAFELGGEHLGPGGYLGTLGQETLKEGRKNVNNYFNGPQGLNTRVDRIFNDARSR